MKNTLKKSILSAIALVSLSVASTVYTGSAQSEITANNIAKLNLIGKLVYTEEKHISDFFSASVKTPYAVLYDAIENIVQDARKSFEPTTRAVGDEITKMIYDIADYALQQFSIPLSIMKKYNGKPSSEAGAFSVEIKRDFNAEKVFGELIARLKVLKSKAMKACETELVSKIDTVITMLEKKRKEWNAKSDFVLFAGLKVRMDAR
jgi:hypothetical protein